MRRLHRPADGSRCITTVGSCEASLRAEVDQQPMFLVQIIHHQFHNIRRLLLWGLARGLTALHQACWSAYGTLLQAAAIAAVAAALLPLVLYGMHQHLSPS